MKRITIKTMALVLSLLLLLSLAPLRVSAAAAGELTAGDVNFDGQVGSDDARLALRASVSLETLTVGQFKSADVDRDRTVTAADARLILRSSVNLETLQDVDPVQFGSRILSAEERRPYDSAGYQIQVLADYYTDVADHAVLDDYYEISFSSDRDFTEEEKLSLVGIGFNGDGEPFIYLPDPDKLEQRAISFRTLHFSLFGVAKLTDEQLIDVWCERAAAQDVTRNIAEEEITPNLRTMVDDAMNSAGLGANQYGGAIVRYLLSHDTKGEILTAAADGDMETLKAKVVNGAGEYILGKVLTGKDDQILTQSVGDHAALVKEGVKKGNYAEATLEIVKSIEKNMFPAVNYADKFAGLTVKMADIWADNTMNEQFETFKKLGGKNISNDDWNTVYIQMYGATHWLSRKGVTAQDIRALFNQRIDNEERIKKEKAEMTKVVAAWKDNNLLSTHYWGRDNGFSATPSLTERLNSLRRIRASLREMLTVDGKLRKGKNYDFATDEEFLLDAVFHWVSNGPKHRDKFYEWLRSEGLLEAPADEAQAAWVLVETRVDVQDSIIPKDPGDYTYTYTATPGAHAKTVSYNGKDGYEYVSFSAACTAPPAVIRPGDTVSMTASVKLDGAAGTRFGGFSLSALVRSDYPDCKRSSIGPGYCLFYSPTDNKTSSCEVKAPSLFDRDPPQSASLNVAHTFGEPDAEKAKTMEDGSRRIGIYFTSSGAQTVWVYEWKPTA